MSSTKSRSDRLLEDYKTGPIFDEMVDEMGKERAEGWAENSAERVVNRENEKFWYLYRALDDASQSDVRELVDPRVETSQSTVSRIIRDKDDSVTHDVDALTPLHAHYEEETLDVLPDKLLEAYKDVIAEAHADWLALTKIAAPTQPTPEWAARRFPELVGCHHYLAKQTGETDIADESHLNQLDSVNTERWK